MESQLYEISGFMEKLLKIRQGFGNDTQYSAIQTVQIIISTYTSPLRLKQVSQHSYSYTTHPNGAYKSTLTPYSLRCCVIQISEQKTDLNSPYTSIKRVKEEVKRGIYFQIPKSDFPGI